MAQTTSVNLGEHFTQLLGELTESGRYRNASEAVREGLRLLEQREAENQAKLDHLRQALIDGENSGVSDSSLDDIFAEVKSELDGQ